MARHVEVDVSEWTSSKAYHVLTSVVAPRPIAWVTSLNEDGSVNAAPFSWFQSICADPPLVMVAFSDRDDGGLKDTPRNILRTKEFVINSVTAELAQRMVATSAGLPPGESEVEKVGLDTVPSKTVAPPRLKDAIAHMECTFVEERRYGDDKCTTMVVGEIKHLHMDDAWVDERGNLRHDAGLLGRLGGKWYVAATKDSTFEVQRPV